jgi:predicted DCC family thiol-disulfide oxidoreductase YuxK
VGALDAEGAIELRPLQDEGARRAFEPGLGGAYWDSFHLVAAGGGRIRSGADALPDLARLLPAVRPFAPWLFGVPGVRWLPRAAYEAAAFVRSCTLPHTHG